MSQYRGQSRWVGRSGRSPPSHPFEFACQALFSLGLDLFMPRSAPQLLLLTFFSGTQTALPFVFLLPFTLFSLLLLSLSVLFLFSLALFSLLLNEEAFGLLFLLEPILLLQMPRGFGAVLLLLVLGPRTVSFPFFSLTSTRLLVLLMSFFGLLLSAFDGPTLGRLSNPIGLLGPLFGHHVSLRDLFPTDH